MANLLFKCILSKPSLTFTLKYKGLLLSNRKGDLGKCVHMLIPDTWTLSTVTVGNREIDQMLREIEELKRDNPSLLFTAGSNGSCRNAGLRIAKTINFELSPVLPEKSTLIFLKNTMHTIKKSFLLSPSQSFLEHSR